MTSNNPSIVSRNMKRIRNDWYKMEEMILSLESVLPSHRFFKLKKQTKDALGHHRKISKKLCYRHNVLMKNNGKMLNKIKELQTICKMN